MPASRLVPVRFGLLALPLAGLVLGISLLVRGSIAHPRQDPLSFALQVTAPGFAPAALGVISGLILLLLALPALYAFLNGARGGAAALPGLGFSVMGVGLLLPLAGALAIALPAAGEQFLEGRAGALDVAFAFFEGSSRWMTLTATLLLTLGQLSFGAALWRTGVSRAAGMLVGASGVLLTVPLWPQSAVSGGAALAVAGVLVVVRAWSATAPPMVEEAAPRHTAGA
jgi:hypothetical protein